MRPSGTSLELGSPAGAIGWNRWVVVAGRLLLASLLLASPGALGADYLADLPDLPLMAGLVERAEGRLVFDKPEGRIVDVRASGRVAPDEVRAFYASALPALGWHSGPNDVWRREGERLTITVRRRGAVTEIRFSLAPEGR